MTGNNTLRKRMMGPAWRASGHGLGALAFLAAVASCAVPGPAGYGPAEYVPAEYQTDLERARTAYLAHDYKQAEPLLRKLADAGNADAQYVVGYMHYYGQGVKRDFVTALEYISLASANGHPNAKQALKRLAEQYENSVRFVSPSSREQTLGPDMQSRTLGRMGSTTSSWATAKGTAAAPAPSRFESFPAARTENDGSTSKKPLNSVVIGATKETGVMAQPPGNYTIQLLAAQDAKTVDDYMREHALQGSVSRFGYHRKGRYWHVLVYGNYPTVAAARSALNNLDRELLAPSPWIRKYADIQYALAAGAALVAGTR